jgi:hypothetical protein
MDEPDGYLSFLLRIWRVNDGKTSVCRASLHHIQTGEQLEFKNLEDLFAYLQRKTCVKGNNLVDFKEKKI